MKKIEKIDIGELPIFNVIDTKLTEPEQTIEIDIEKPINQNDLSEPPKNNDLNISVFILALLRIADQSKIIHFQADTKHEHIEFGNFYDEFIVIMDDLVESILGKYGLNEFKFGSANLELTDRDLAISNFFTDIDYMLREIPNQIFDKEIDNEIFAKIDELLMLKNKTQYLLLFK